MNQIYEQKLKAGIIKTITDNYKEISKVGNGLESFKAAGGMTTSGNIDPSGAVQQFTRPEVAYRGPGDYINFRDLVRIVESTTGQYSYYRELAGEGSIAYQTPDLIDKAQKDYDYQKFTILLDYLAGWVTIARQMLEDMGLLKTSLPIQLMNSFIKQENLEMANFLNVIGLTNSAAPTKAEKLLDFIRIIRNFGYNPNGIVLSHVEYQSLLSTLPANAFYGFWIHPLTGQTVFAGIPIYSANWAPGPQCFVADWNQLELVVTDEIGIDFSYENATNFVDNAVTVKIEQRQGLAILQRDAIIRGSLA